MRKNKKKAWKY